MRILIIEDEPKAASCLRQGLRVAKETGMDIPYAVDTHALRTRATNLGR